MGQRTNTAVDFAQEEGRESTPSSPNKRVHDPGNNGSHSKGKSKLGPELISRPRAVPAHNETPLPSDTNKNGGHISRYNLGGGGDTQMIVLNN